MNAAWLYVMHRTETTGRFQAGAGWVHAYGNTDSRNRFVFAEGGDRFTIYGVSVPRDAAYLNLGFAVNLTRQLNAAIAYDGFLGKKTQRHGGRLSLEYTF